MKKAKLSKELRNFIDENCPYGWKIGKDNHIIFARNYYCGRAIDFSNDTGTVFDWQFDYDYSNNLV